MEATIKADQENVEALMDVRHRTVETEINSFQSELEETIKIEWRMACHLSTNGDPGPL
jgi:hypothetical protein